MLRASQQRSSVVRGFTIMELATVIVIIGILLALVIPGYGYLRSRAERSKCTANIKNLYVSVTLHIQEQGQWPQVDTRLFGKPPFADGWIKALERYNMGPENWVCPSIQRVMNDPDIYKPANRRIDYYATPFGPERALPYRYPRQPWFIERADMHGEGQLIVFGNGEIKTLREVLRDRRVQQMD